MEGVTALVAAVRNNRASTVSLLIDRGADVNKEDTVKGITPLKAAVEDDNCALVELLIKRGAAVDHVNRNGRTGFSSGFHSFAIGVFARVSTLIKWSV